MSAKLARTTGLDNVRELQRTLYRAAKADPERRFHALHDKVYRKDVLERAWVQVRRNRGAPGIDRITIAQIERQGIDLLLDDLARDLKDGSYRPKPARRVFIPKPHRPGERRGLSVPTVRDRIVQVALKIVIEPIFEADFLPCSFGFRPKRSAHDALQVLIDESFTGRRWVVESDIANCFEAIPHDRLMGVIEGRIVDRNLLKLLRGLLRAGVMEDGAVRKAVSGTPQGGGVSPLLCNVYLNLLDRAWPQRGHGVMCRYADDVVVMCATKREAESALVAFTAILDELGLEPKLAKTRIVHLAEGGEGLDFLGFHHRYVRGNTDRSRHLTFLARWPSRQATHSCKARIRELTQRRRTCVAVEVVVQEVNASLRGWAGYFRYGNSARAFAAIRYYALMRLAIFMANRHRKDRWFGWAMVLRSPDQLGLIRLDGRVIAPRPNRGWRGPPNAGGEGRR
ncbi:MAG: group II intron reverse transcriptase/maturase [Nitrococcus sp.]|nr:group II intron reverse transcriptase/maturase [Nitrococcus sp.]